MFIVINIDHFFECICPYFILQSTADEAAATGTLMDLLLKKSNYQFDEFCNALHATEQTHVVQNQLITYGNNFSITLY